MINDIMKNLLKERPVGSKNNMDILQYLEKMMVDMGYAVEKLPFTCTTWETGESCLILNDKRIEIQASPFSQPFEGSGRLEFVRSLEELETVNCRDCILVVGGELVETPLQPKEYPFYYPDEHRHLIELFERKQPAAIIAATGKHALCGLQPFPLFEDGNFPIPSAYIPAAMFEELQLIDKDGMAGYLFNQRIYSKTVISLWRRKGIKAIMVRSLYVRIWTRSIIRKGRLTMQLGLPC